MSSPLKLLYLVGQLGLGGSERQLYLLLRSLDKTAAQALVVVFNPSPHLELNQALEAAGVRVIQIPRGCASVPRRMAFLFRLFRRERPHVVHSWTIHDNPYAGIVGWLAGVPLRWGSLRGSLSLPWFATLPRLFRWLALHSVQRILVNAASLQTELAAAGVAPGRIHILPNCVDLSDPLVDCDRHEGLPVLPADLSALGIPPGAAVVGMVGNLRRVKNHALFIEAFTRLAARFPAAYAFIAGQSLPDEPALPAALTAQIASAGLAHRIILGGFRADVPALMRRFSVLCLASDSEGTPNVILEALAAGTPVVATRVGGVPDVVQDGVTGLLVPPGDASALSDALSRLLANPALAQQMGAAGQARVQSDYACPAIASHLLALYRQRLQPEA